MNQALCDFIRKAFAGVKLGDGVGLQEAQGLDDYADEATCADYRSMDEKEDWRLMPIEELNRCYSSLCFFDAEGMRFHLPVYLIADLLDIDRFGIVFSLTHLSDSSKSQFALLSSEQRRAVRAFLLHIFDEPNYEFERHQITRALDEY